MDNIHTTIFVVGGAIFFAGFSDSIRNNAKNLWKSAAISMSGIALAASSAAHYYKTEVCPTTPTSVVQSVNPPTVHPG